MAYFIIGILIALYTRANSYYKTSVLFAALLPTTWELTVLFMGGGGGGTFNVKDFNRVISNQGLICTYQKPAIIQ